MIRSPTVQPLEGVLVVELTRLLPGAYAGRELLDLGARVVRLEAPDGDPMRTTAPAWDEALSAGKESVVCDLKTEPRARARAALAGRRRARGVPARRRRAARASGRGRCPSRSSTARSPASASRDGTPQRAGHDLNYLGWAGALADTAPGAAAGAGGGPRRRRARGRQRRPRGALVARAQDGRGPPRRRLDDARLAPPGLAPAAAASRCHACSPAASPATGSTAPPTAAG